MLDGAEINKSEKIIAKQKYKQIIKQLNIEKIKCIKRKEKESNDPIELYSPEIIKDGV